MDLLLAAHYPPAIAIDHELIELEAHRAGRHSTRLCCAAEGRPSPVSRVPSAVSRLPFAGLMYGMRAKSKAARIVAGKPVRQITPEHFHDPVLPYVRPPVIVLRPDETLAEVLAHIRALPSLDSIHYFYVVNAKNRLIGVVPLRRLLTGSSERTVKEVMETKVEAIPDFATVLVASEFFVDKDLLAFPVVDSKNRLLGVVDIMLFNQEVLTRARQAYDDIFQLIGVRATATVASPWTALRSRFPWLVCNIAGGLLAAAIASQFQPLLAAVVVLALFIPIVTALSESVSMQAVTLTINGLTDGPIQFGRMASTLMKELRTAVLLGVVCGGLTGLVVWAWLGDLYVAIVTGGSIVVSMIVSCLIGVVVPTVLRSMRADPKIAAGPVVLASVDIVTLLCYFGLGMRLLMRE
jgi:magnesium transporter